MEEFAVHLAFDDGNVETYKMHGIPRIGENVVLKVGPTYRVKNVTWEGRSGNRLVPFVELEIDKK